MTAFAILAMFCMKFCHCVNLCVEVLLLSNSNFLVSFSRLLLLNEFYILLCQCPISDCFSFWYGKCSKISVRRMVFSSQLTASSVRETINMGRGINVVAGAGKARQVRPAERSQNSLKFPGKRPNGRVEKSVHSGGNHFALKVKGNPLAFEGTEVSSKSKVIGRVHGSGKNIFKRAKISLTDLEKMMEDSDSDEEENRETMKGGKLEDTQLTTSSRNTGQGTHSEINSGIIEAHDEVNLMGAFLSKGTLSKNTR